MPLRFLYITTRKARKAIAPCFFKEKIEGYTMLVYICDCKIYDIVVKLTNGA